MNNYDRILERQEALKLICTKGQLTDLARLNEAGKKELEFLDSYLNLVDLNKKMDSARDVAVKTDNLATFNGWGKMNESVIDYIYIKGFSSCPSYKTIRKEYDGRKFISDHYPIAAVLVF